MTNEEYVDFLEHKGKGYVWQFTKQETDFEKIFLSAKLFNEWKQNTQNLSLEEFFIEQHNKYGITDRHRTLIIAQLYGLITKNSSGYVNENVTPVFKQLSQNSSPETYKSIVSEQLLKIKIPALTASRRSDTEDIRHIFPIIFIYQVLKRLKQFSINSITIEELYTYVMTANFHTDMDRVITFLTQPIKPTISSSLLHEFQDRCRILTMIDNINLFSLDRRNGFIAINTMYETKMDNFLEENLSRFIDSKLTNENEYKEFLYEIQNFNINLIDEDVAVIVSEDNEDIIEDVEYTENVALQSYDNTQVNVEPHIIQTNEREIIRRDPALGAIAINNSNYQCENDTGHQTFISKRTKRPYMEAHHLIPISQSQYIWKKKHKNIDCIENIVSLCPTCHRAIHHGEFETKLQILKNLYDKRINDLRRAGIDIDFETLLKFYL